MLKKIKFICIFVFFCFFITELVLRLCGWKEAPRIYEEIDDPNVRWVHTAGYTGKMFETDISINSQRLRDKEYPFDKPKDTFRIIAVGECTVFGRGVPLENSFVKKLETMLNVRKPLSGFKHYEVINAGVVQYTDLQKISFLKKFGLKYQPDLIIFGHDLGAKVWFETRAKFRWYRLLRDKIPKQIYSVRYLIFGIEKFILTPWAANIAPKREDPTTIINRYHEAGLSNIKTDEAFKELGLLTKQVNIPAIIVFMPWLADLDENQYKYFEVHELFKKMSKENNLIFLDLYNAYFKNKRPEPFWMDDQNRRPNALAYEMIANETYHELINVMTSGGQKIVKKRSSNSIYNGPLIDAVTQWDRNSGDLDKLMSHARSSGVTKIAIGLRGTFSKTTTEDQFYKTLIQYDSFAIPASPKFFPGEIRRSVVDHLIASIHQYKYAFVSEAMFRHADKRLGKIHKKGEISIDPLSSNSRYLLDRLSKENVPLFVHWEFYLWDLDYPKFSKLFSLYPKQKFIISHMGFGSSTQMETLLRKHPNVLATISKRDSRFEYFLNDSTFQGSSLLNEAGKLREEWRELFCRYPDRFLFATDAHKDYMWNAYKELVARYRVILGQLPRQVAEQIAYQNAKQIGI